MSLERVEFQRYFELSKSFEEQKSSLDTKIKYLDISEGSRIVASDRRLRIEKRAPSMKLREG